MTLPEGHVNSRCCAFALLLLIGLSALLLIVYWDSHRLAVATAAERLLAELARVWRRPEAA